MAGSVFIFIFYPFYSCASFVNGIWLILSICVYFIVYSDWVFTLYWFMLFVFSLFILVDFGFSCSNRFLVLDKVCFCWYLCGWFCFVFIFFNFLCYVRVVRKWYLVVSIYMYLPIVYSDCVSTLIELMSFVFSLCILVGYQIRVFALSDM